MMHIIELNFVAEKNPACWRNFIDSISCISTSKSEKWIDNISNTLRQDYSAEMSFKDEKNSVGPILVFDNEQDYVKFILRWS